MNLPVIVNTYKSSMGSFGANSGLPTKTKPNMGISPEPALSAIGCIKCLDFRFCHQYKLPSIRKLGNYPAFSSDSEII